MIETKEPKKLLIREKGKTDERLLPHVLKPVAMAKAVTMILSCQFYLIYLLVLGQIVLLTSLIFFSCAISETSG